MKDSTFSQPLPEPLWLHAADGYYSDGSPVHRGWHVYPTMAAAGLWTTPADLAKFAIAIQEALRGQSTGPIDATIAREMTTPSTGQEYALGLQAKSDYFMHTGANEGFQGEILGLLRGGRGVAIMTNSDNGIHIANEILHAVAIVYGAPADGEDRDPARPRHHLLIRRGVPCTGWPGSCDSQRTSRRRYAHRAEFFRWPERGPVR
jgi:CubicO group peptidase (beta-lactamase class C family)